MNAGLNFELCMSMIDWNLFPLISNVNFGGMISNKNQNQNENFYLARIASIFNIFILSLACSWRNGTPRLGFLKLKDTLCIINS